MKIVHIITGLNNGGAEAVLYRLCRADNNNQHVVVSLLDKGKYGPLLEQNGVDVRSLQMPRGRLTLSGVRRLAAILRDLRPDLVQTWMYHSDLVGGVLARALGIRAVCWNIRHSNLEPVKVKRSTLLTARISMLMSRSVPTLIICCSHEAARVHEALGYPPDKLRVIPNGYDLQSMTPNAQARRDLRQQLGVPDDMPLIGMVARYDPQKDHANLLSALGLLKTRGIRFRCALIGNGLEAGNTELMAEMHRQGVAGMVSLLGPRDDVSGVMSALDLHVLSSAYGEGFPNAVAEAMACGTPCVATDVGAGKSIIGETGWTAPIKDARALADALAMALSAREGKDWPERRRRCRERIALHFGLPKMVEAYDHVWHEALAASRA